MMELEFCQSNHDFKSNKVKRTKQSWWWWVPIATVIKYFIWNYENIYFLILSIFQLLTLGILPQEWSPTGAFSTAIPLMICICAEILTNMVKWYKSWKMDRQENNKIYQCLHKDGHFFDKKSQELFPGDVIYLKKEDICPIDGILLDSTKNEKYSKISLALLTGESNINYATKPHKDYKLKDYEHSKLIIDEYYPHNFHNISGKIVFDDQKEIHVDGNSFIVGGSIIKSDDVYIWITRCGKDKKSYLETLRQNERKMSRIDNFVGQYMINVNVILLIGLIFIITTIKVYLSQITLLNIVFYAIQNWILFNGIIPFSVKIFLILARSLQSYLLTRKHSEITINNSLQIDDFGKIGKIISDKTGTLTRNELELSKLIQVNSNDIVDIEAYHKSHSKINLEFHKCLGLCIHQTDGDFNTAEDKTIRYKYQFLNNRISQTGSKITLFIAGDKYDFHYVEIAGFDFTFERRMSSKIVKDSKNKYFIYSKGALDVISKKVNGKYETEVKRLDEIISQKFPELRLLGCAYKEINGDDIEQAIINSHHRNMMTVQFENDLEFLGIVGIKDNLQHHVTETINRLKERDLPCSLCTGDRKITAIAIAKEAGILDNFEVFDYNLDNKDINIPNINHKTLLFSGAILELITKDSNLSQKFYEDLKRCKNFIGYNLIPDHKRKITNILETKGVRTLAIGDGFNDIGMFDVSSLSVAIKGNAFVENSADFAIQEFSNLSTLLDMSINTYYKNSHLINFVFYRCSAVIFSIVTYCLINYKLNVSLFNGFVIQAFNFAWTILGLGYYVLNDDMIKRHYSVRDFYRNKYMVFTSNEYTTIWNLAGILTGILYVLISRKWLHHSQALHDIIGLLLISVMNIKLIQHHKKNMIGILLSSLGILNFMIYTLFAGTFVSMMRDLLFASQYFWISLLGSSFVLNLFLT
jgi:magnesium-transporting ATPase (P-type)